MLIVCPSCASEYTIDPAKLGPQGRTVRCAICRDTWFAAPEGIEPAVAEAPPPGATLLAAPKRAPARRISARLLVAAAAVAAAAGLWAVPRSWIEVGGAAATQLVRPERAVLAFRSVLSEVGGPSGDRVLTVSGEIVNRGTGAADLPHLEFLVRNADEQVLATWTSAPPRQSLGPAEAVRFEARLMGPPAGARDVRVQFTKASGVAVAFRALP